MVSESGWIPFVCPKLFASKVAVWIWCFSISTEDDVPPGVAQFFRSAPLSFREVAVRRGCRRINTACGPSLAGWKYFADQLFQFLKPIGLANERRVLQRPE